MLVAKTGFSYDLNMWTAMDGLMSARSHPNIMFGNLTRFHPFWALIEMTMGIAAARDVMLDSQEERSKKRTNPLVYFLASYAALGLRLTSLDFNDAIIRSTMFVPLFTKFLTALHRDCLSENPAAITKFFGSKVMSSLGSLAFPMFILHGPIGQVFYKKALAKRLWGKAMPRSFFPVYLLIVLLASHLTNEYFVKSKRVQALSARVSQFLARHTEGMLQDGEP
jgi:peptidoglycan/LPS O-acetylase OafA/YrhL